MLFGKFCSGHIFEHDEETASCSEKHELLPTQERRTPDTGSQESSIHTSGSPCCRSLVADPAMSVSAFDADRNRDDTSMMEPLVHADIRPEGEIIPDHAVISDAHENSFCHDNRHDLVPQETPSTTYDVPAFPSKKRPFSEPHDESGDNEDDDVAGAFHYKGEQESQRTNASTDSFPSPYQTSSRYEAYQAMLSNSSGTGSWMPISLLSTDANHGVADTEL